MTMMSQAETKEHVHSGHLATAGKCALWLASLVIAGFIGSYAASIFTYNDSVNLQDRQERLEGIQQFQQSAAAVDNAFQVFNDALVDGHDVEDARRGLRTAIARNSSDANAFQSVLGPVQTKSYIAALARFRTLVDETKAPTNAMPMAQAGLDLITDRNRLLKEAEMAVKKDSAGSWIPLRRN